MRADRQVKKDFEDLSDYAVSFYKDKRYTPEQLRNLQNETYHQLNEYILRGKYDPDHWCNGVFLTAEGHKFLKRVVKIADFYNFDDSDSMTDYYHVNFSFHLSLGQWNKPFVDGPKEPKRARVPSIPTGATHVIDGSGLRELTKEEKETGKTKAELEKRWFSKTDWSKVVFEL